MVRQFFAVLLACNYFAFRTEIFSEEFERNHPPIDPCSGRAVLNLPSLNWETFDKDNAPKAITVIPEFFLLRIGPVPEEQLPTIPSTRLQHRVRDKSPPSVADIS